MKDKASRESRKKQAKKKKIERKLIKQPQTENRYEIN